jgi:hypothetical protein
VACARCIGDICVRPKLMSDDELVRRYGPGEHKDLVLGGTVDSRKRCYFDSAQGLWVLVDLYHVNAPPPQQLHVVGVQVSSEALCGKAVSPRKPFPQLVLATGLGIGDKESSALAQSGQPQRIDDTLALERNNPRLKDIPGFGSRFGERKLAYEKILFLPS